jgi:hypothetical protein
MLFYHNHPEVGTGPGVVSIDRAHDTPAGAGKQHWDGAPADPWRTRKSAASVPVPSRRVWEQIALARVMGRLKHRRVGWGSAVARGWVLGCQARRSPRPTLDPKAPSLEKGVGSCMPS